MQAVDVHVCLKSHVVLDERGNTFHDDGSGTLEYLDSDRVSHGELAAVTAVALPVGSLIGYGLSRLIVGSLTSEVFRIPLVVQPSTIAWGWIVIAAAATLSGLVVRRRLDQLDLVAVLKTRE